MPQLPPVYSVIEKIEKSLPEPQISPWRELLRGLPSDQLDSHDLQRLAHFLQKESLHHQAAQLYRYLAMATPTSIDPVIQTSLELMQAKNYRDADAALSESVKRLQQTSFQVQLQRGILLTERGMHQQARELLGALYQQNPSNAKVALHYALSCGFALRGPEAASVLEKIITELQSEPADLAYTYYAYATSLFARRVYQNAVSCIQKAIEIHPNRELYREFLQAILDAQKRNESVNTDVPAGADENVQIYINKTPELSSRSIGETSVFEKYVPPGMREKKTGLKICYIASVDTCSVLSHLAKAMDKYSPHRTRRIFFVHQDLYSLDDPNWVDIVFNQYPPIPEDHPQLDEVRAIIREADFFHIGENLYPVPGIDWNKIIRPNNSVWQYFGTGLRVNQEKLFDFHLKTGIQGVYAWDSTCARALPYMVYHMQPFPIDFDSLPEWNPPKSPIRVCQAPTHRIVKGSEYFIEAMRELSKKYDLETVMIEQVTNEECLNIKASCHMLFDDVSSIGLNGIEAMALGQPAIGVISGYMRFIHPDVPVVSTLPHKVKDTLEDLIVNEEKRLRIGKQSREWVRKMYAPQARARDWGLLYDFLKNGDRPFELFAEEWEPEVLNWGREYMLD